MDLKATLWPNVNFYGKQKEIIYSVQDDDETYSVAGNMLGKDFVGGYVPVWFFTTRFPCRVIISSATDDHLDVIFGELKRFIYESEIPLTYEDGGPLKVLDREINRILSDGTESPLCYIKGMVAKPDKVAALQGHHIAKVGDMIPRTLWIADEASAVPSSFYKMARGWADRMLVIGNPWQCSNFFREAVRNGNVKRKHRSGYHQRVIHISADDSPNIQLAKIQIEQGRKPTGEMVVPGVKGWDDYQKNLATWDEEQICVGLEGRFYEGDTIKMYPPGWLVGSGELAATLDKVMPNRVPTHLAVDSAEGGDNTTFAAGDKLGMVLLRIKKTPDTSYVVDETIDLIDLYGIDEDNVMFDRGGGGQEHVDRLRRLGYNVRSVAFGEAATSADRFKRFKSKQDRIEAEENRTVYFNRRAEMYGLLRKHLNPVNEDPTNHISSGGLTRLDNTSIMRYAIPASLLDKPTGQGRKTLRDQLDGIPLKRDSEGRLKLPPKKKRTATSTEESLEDIIGHSPDEADAIVMLNYVTFYKPSRRILKSPV
jgi:hypothetical protein